MKLEWTINIGNILVAVGLLAGFFAAHIQNVRRLQSIETRVEMLYEWFRRRVLGAERSDDDDD